MEARSCPRRGQLATVALALAVSLLSSAAFAASARTQNFMVSAATQELANEIARAAEQYRHDLAIEWLGKELPDWEQPCPITAQVDPRHGAGGATSFMFGNGRPYGWTMSIQGSRERVLDSVLPHEVTHTIFATHFGRPLPRWADEGACTTVEHVSEKSKQEKLLYQFLTTNRGIPFNKMFAMKEYPRDILPLYSQGYALARYLIALGGKPKFVDYVGAGMQSNNWTAVTNQFYGFHSLSDLQLSWLEWVRKGTPAIQDASDVLYVSTDAKLNGRTLAEILGEAPSVLRNNETTVAMNDNVPRNRLPNAGRSTLAMPASTEAATPIGQATPVADRRSEAAPRVPANSLPDQTSRPSGDGWYERRRDMARRGVSSVGAASDDTASERPAASFASLSRPQPPEQVKQTLLDWKKNERALAPSGR